MKGKKTIEIPIVLIIAMECLSFAPIVGSDFDCHI